MDRNFTLSEAWKLLKKVHPQAQPNYGFGRILLELDKKIHRKAFMKWQKPRCPTMKVCPLCGKNAGLSSSSLKLLFKNCIQHFDHHGIMEQ